MSDTPNGNGTTARWQIIVSVGGLVVVVMGALIGLLLTINTQGAMVASLTVRVQELEIGRGLQRDALAKVQLDIGGIQRDMVEIETQFCGEDNMRNLMHAFDLRTMAMLWQKSMGADLPIGNAFYPRVGRCAAPQ